MSLTDRVALITGGTGALGSVIAHRLGQEGAQVWVTCRGSLDVRKAEERGWHAVEADVTKEADVVRLFADVAQEAGRLDVLVNTVGGFVTPRPVRDVRVDEWDGMMELNLKSVFLCIREALQIMEHQSYGRIISIAAKNGLTPGPGRAPYSVSKAGVVFLTSVVAEEVKGSGITVNCIAPSIILTEANRTSMPKEDHRAWVKPEEIAAAIVFLCSEEAGSANGTTIRAFGGL